MDGFIPEDKLSEVKNASNLVDIVSEVVLLKRSGKDFWGLCPFHSEKTPSFKVDPEKQAFFCFGCKTGGNVFTFLMKHEGVSFPEAVRILARRFSIPIPESNASKLTSSSSGKREHILEANRSGMLFFKEKLRHPDSGRSVREYLEKRQLRKETIDEFGLGYAPEGWDQLIRYLVKKKIPMASALQSGLIISKQGGRGYYDRFRNRVMFPIFNLSDQVIGFGGRVLDDSLPKYINSPETDLFKKSRSLYGVHKARTYCREKNSVFIVEGYMDLLAMHQSGFKNTVATLGTGLTEEHIRILKGFCRRFYLLYDSDEAGIKATEKIIGILAKENIDARVVTLPEGFDPDSFLRERRPEELTIQVNRSRGVMDFLIETAVGKHDLSIEGKIRILSELETSLSAIEDHVQRSLFIQAVSERIDVNESSLLEKIRTFKREHHQGRVLNRKWHESRPDVQSLSDESGVRLEKKLVAMMLQFPAMIPIIKEKQLVDQFTDPMLKSIARRILKYDGDPMHITREIINPTENDFQESLIAQLALDEERWNKAGGLKLIDQFQRRLLRQQKKPLINRIKAAEDSNDEYLLEKLLKERQSQSRKNESSPLRSFGDHHDKRTSVGSKKI